MILHENPELCRFVVLVGRRGLGRRGRYHLAEIDCVEPGRRDDDPSRVIVRTDADLNGCFLSALTACAYAELEFCEHNTFCARELLER